MFKLIRGDRKSISLEVKDDLSILVKAPLKMPDSKINEFVLKHQRWIEKQREKVMARNQKLLSCDVVELKAKAKEILPQRVDYFSSLMGLTPTGVKITSAKTRFGSCNGKNSICFSLYLMLYPDEAIDYVVVHELAHIKYKNHGKAFYALIERYLPDYKNRIKMLKQ